MLSTPLQLHLHRENEGIWIISVFTECYYNMENWKWKLVIQLYLTLSDSMDYIARQVPLSIEFSKQEYWSR